MLRHKPAADSRTAESFLPLLEAPFMMIDVIRHLHRLQLNINSKIKSNGSETERSEIMDPDHSNLKLEKKILNISFAGSIGFLIAEIIVAIWTGSAAVLMDCVFDIADLIMIGPFMVLIPLLYKPITETKPYGYSQVESLFVMIKTGILICVTAYLIIHSIKTILAGGNEVDASIVAIYELAVSLTCVIVYLILSRINKKFSSPSIKAEIYIWKLDSMSTLGVGLGFILQIVLDHIGFKAIGPYVDPGIAILVAAILLKEPIGLFVEALKNLMLFAPDNETSDKIRETSEKIMQPYGVYINFLDIIKTGRKYWIDIYFVCDKDLISISRLKEIHKSLTEELKEIHDSVFVELIPDTDKITEKNRIRMEAARRPEKISYMESREKKQLEKKAAQQKNTQQ